MAGFYLEVLVGKDLNFETRALQYPCGELVQDVGLARMNESKKHQSPRVVKEYTRGCQDGTSGMDLKRAEINPYNTRECMEQFWSVSIIVK